MLKKFLSIENLKEARATMNHFNNLLNGGCFEEINGTLQRSSSIENERKVLKNPVWMHKGSIMKDDYYMFESEELEYILKTENVKGVWYYDNFGYCIEYK